MLGALAQATSRIRIGAMVNGMHHRHPAVTATWRDPRSRLRWSLRARDGRRLERDGVERLRDRAGDAAGALRTGSRKAWR